MAPVGRWEVKADRGDKWAAFTPEDSATLEAAYTSDPAAVFVTKDLSFNKEFDTLYRFDFGKMVQVNTESKKTRHIRRVVDAPPSGKRKAEEDADAPAAKAAKPDPPPPSLAGEVICITGTLSALRAAVVKTLEARGATVVDAVTKKCTMLMCGSGAEGTSKYGIAKAKGVKIVQEEDVLRDGASATSTTVVPSSSSSTEIASSSSAAAAPTSAVLEESEAPAGLTGKSKGQQTKTLIKKGRGVVDTHSGLVDTAHIYEEGEDVYQVTLNQTNIGQNNNKFYIIQLLEADAGGKWWVWTRWARVGQVGQSKLEPCHTLDKAKSNFAAKFCDKTSNQWDDRQDFVKVPGKYMLMDIDYGAEDAEDPGPASPAAAQGVKVPECKLHTRVQDIIKMISDVKMMTAAMAELEIDVKKMPIGKISKGQVKKGYEVLTRIAEALKANKGGAVLASLSSDFYTVIPHDFGMKVPAVINTEAAIHRKIELLDTLADLEIASKLLGTSGSAVPENPIDSAYKRIKCHMEPLDKGSDIYKIILQYVQNTHGKTHTAYTLEVEDVLEIKREGETERFMADVGNRTLLWHGSRLSNFMGILSQGLRIAPPEAPATGYMFGKGIYFADMVTKSANYCHANKKDNVAMMLLADVALGNHYPLKGAKYMDKAPPGYHSTKGLGTMAPDPAVVTTVGGVKVPLGTSVSPPDHAGSSLLYNEFIVYDVAQVNLRYLLKVKFKFK